MYLYACGALLAVATVLNWRDRRMLALTLLVGATVFLPVPAHSQAQFYSTCILVECSIAAYGIFFGGRPGNSIAFICFLMILCHFGGWILDGSQPLSPYRVLIKFLEFSQLLTCVASSALLRDPLRNRHAATS